MKTDIKSICLVLLSAFLLTACEKELDKTVAKTGRAGTLTASQATLVLSSANAADTVEAFTWTMPDYGFKAAITNTLQIAKGGTDFAAPKEVIMGSRISQKYNGADLNQIALLLGLIPGSEGELDVRVKSIISDSITPVYSNELTVTVSPYLVIINYPSLWVPGDYQGWDPATAPKISSKADNGIYEGYVNFPSTSNSFKFKYTSEPDWNHTNYGWVSSTVTGNDVSGTFNSSGGDLFVPGAGYYLLKANTNDNSWSGTYTTWGLIGDGVPVTGWDSDQDLTYNATDMVWTITLNLNSGKIKFRANDDWAINYGDTNADRSLEINGSDITITEAGNYTITLDLHIPANYTYGITKN